MSGRNFRELLRFRQKAVNSLVCVGLDPLAEKLPLGIRVYCPSEWTAVSLQMQEVVDQTAPFACMFKPQRAHWEAIPRGVEALRLIVAYIHLKYPGIPVFLDCKRGDIDRTQACYREAHFTLDGVDGMNFNGYMGKDTLKSLIDPAHPGRALVGLGRTSNPEAWEIQDLQLARGDLFWEFMVERLCAWSEELGVIQDAGIVMGAAHRGSAGPNHIYSGHLSRAREIVGDKMWFLIPGIGTQGGFVEQTVKAAFAGPGSIAINSSSGIIFAASPAGKAEELRDQIRVAGGSC